MSPNDADGMANSVDPDQTAPLGASRSSLILVCTVCPSLSVRKLRNITGYKFEFNSLCREYIYLTLFMFTEIVAFSSKVFLLVISFGAV